MTFIRPLYVRASFRMLFLACKAAYSKCLDLKRCCALYRLAVIRVIAHMYCYASSLGRIVSLILLHYITKAFRKFGQGFASFIFEYTFAFAFGDLPLFIGLTAGGPDT